MGHPADSYYRYPDGRDPLGQTGLYVSKGKEGIRQISPTVWVLFAIFVLRYVQKSLS